MKMMSILLRLTRALRGTIGNSFSLLLLKCLIRSLRCSIMLITRGGV